MKIFVSMKVPRADAELRQAAEMLAETISSAGHQPFLATDEIAKRGLTDPQASHGRERPCYTYKVR